MRTTGNESPVGDTFKRVASGAHDAADKVAEATSGAAESLSDTGEMVCEAQQEGFKILGEYVQENPVKSVAMAVAGGFLISRLFGASKPNTQTFRRGR